MWVVFSHVEKNTSKASNFKVYSCNSTSVFYSGISWFICLAAFFLVLSNEERVNRPSHYNIEELTLYCEHESLVYLFVRKRGRMFKTLLVSLFSLTSHSVTNGPQKRLKLDSNTGWERPENPLWALSLWSLPSKRCIGANTLTQVASARILQLV